MAGEMTRARAREVLAKLQRRHSEIAERYEVEAGITSNRATDVQWFADLASDHQEQSAALDLALAALAAERDRLEAQVAAVRAVHAEDAGKDPWSGAEYDVCKECQAPYPCATIRALGAGEATDG